MLSSLVCNRIGVDRNVADAHLLHWPVLFIDGNLFHGVQGRVESIDHPLDLEGT